jgi:hypothetical protein
MNHPAAAAARELVGAPGALEGLPLPPSRRPLALLDIGSGGGFGCPLSF